MRVLCLIFDNDNSQIINPAITENLAIQSPSMALFYSYIKYIAIWLFRSKITALNYLDNLSNSFKWLIIAYNIKRKMQKIRHLVLTDSLSKPSHVLSSVQQTSRFNFHHYYHWVY